MSIFSCLDIDQIVLSFLDIDDLRNLYQVNKYYKDKIFAILEPFIKFYQKIDTLELPDWICFDKHFNKAIIYGNLQVFLTFGESASLCKYLINKHGNKKINDSFQLSCQYGHLGIAKWLYSLGNVDIHADNNCNDAFRFSYLNNHLEVVKWLCSLDTNIHKNNNMSAFRFSCEQGHLEIAKWLYSLGGIDMRAFDDYALRYACQNGHLKVAKWLCILDSRYKIKVIDKKIEYTIISL